MARLTKAEWRTIAYALNCAIEERDSFADAYRMKIIGIPSACIDDTAEGIAKAIRARKDQEHG